MKILFTEKDMPSVVSNYILPIMNKVTNNVINNNMSNVTIFTLQGPLGAGKTSLVKEILRQNNVTDVVTSPTFTYVKNYSNPSGQTFHHFDLYRIGSLENFIAAGFDEYLYENSERKSFCFIEWPEIIFPLLDQQENRFRTCKISLNYDPNDLNQRQIEF